MPELDTSRIGEWRSIVTIIVFFVANTVPLFIYKIPVSLPRFLVDYTLDLLAASRVIAPRYHRCNCTNHGQLHWLRHAFMRFNLPINWLTAPLIAVLLLLAITAIGQQEVRDGILGNDGDGVLPGDVVALYITTAYISLSIGASGIMRYLMSWVVCSTAKVGHRLYLCIYVFFIGLGTLVGSDNSIRAGTGPLADFCRVTTNIVNPRAWVFAQFAVVNICSAILVSSSPANLIIASAFGIRFAHCTANVVVPVVFTAIALFLCLLYLIFPDEALIPITIKMQELPEEALSRKPVNMNIPHVRGAMHDTEDDYDNDEPPPIALEELMNPFLDKVGAGSKVSIATAMIATLLALNPTAKHPVYWVTLPAACLILCVDIFGGWSHRHETRQIALAGQIEIERARAERAVRAASSRLDRGDRILDSDSHGASDTASKKTGNSANSLHDESDEFEGRSGAASQEDAAIRTIRQREEISRNIALRSKPRSTLVSGLFSLWAWCRQTFPTATAIIPNLPIFFLPTAFCLFVLCQAMVTKGWVAVFAHGWDHWVRKTGTVGAIGGMGFLSVVLRNVAGTDIGATILLSRIIQAWQAINLQAEGVLSNRTFWGTVYTMALGISYGAFSVSHRASLSGMDWANALAKKGIRIRLLDFARVNLPIIIIAMTVGCAVLAGEVYNVRDERPY